jgi:hypothetical protein
MCSKFSSSWQQLKKAQGWWRKEKVDQDFRQTVTNICKFVTKSAHEGNMFFNKEGCWHFLVSLLKIELLLLIAMVPEMMR